MDTFWWAQKKIQSVLSAYDFIKRNDTINSTTLWLETESSFNVVRGAWTWSIFYIENVHRLSLRVNTFKFGQLWERTNRWTLDISSSLTQGNQSTLKQCSYSLCPAAACLSAVPADPPPVSCPATGQPVCGRILLYIQPAGLLQPAGQPAEPHQRAQHRNLELCVSIRAMNHLLLCHNTDCVFHQRDQCWKGQSINQLVLSNHQSKTQRD